MLTVFLEVKINQLGYVKIECSLGTISRPAYCSIAYKFIQALILQSTSTTKMMSKEDVSSSFIKGVGISPYLESKPRLDLLFKEHPGPTPF